MRLGRDRHVEPIEGESLVEPKPFRSRKRQFTKRNRKRFGIRVFRRWPWSEREVYHDIWYATRQGREEGFKARLRFMLDHFWITRLEKIERNRYGDPR